MKTVLLTFGLLLLLIGSLGVISFAGDYFREHNSCKSADEHDEKAKKLLQENKLKEAEMQVTMMTGSQKVCNEVRAEAKSSLTVWSAGALLGLLMTIGGFSSFRKNKREEEQKK